MNTSTDSEFSANVSQPPQLAYPSTNGSGGETSPSKPLQSGGEFDFGGAPSAAALAPTTPTGGRRPPASAAATGGGAVTTSVTISALAADNSYHHQSLAPTNSSHVRGGGSSAAAFVVQSEHHRPAKQQQQQSEDGGLSHAHGGVIIHDLRPMLQQQQQQQPSPQRHTATHSHNSYQQPTGDDAPLVGFVPTPTVSPRPPARQQRRVGDDTSAGSMGEEKSQPLSSIGSDQAPDSVDQQQQQQPRNTTTTVVRQYQTGAPLTDPSIAAARCALTAPAASDLPLLPPSQESKRKEMGADNSHSTDEKGKATGEAVVEAAPTSSSPPPSPRSPPPPPTTSVTSIVTTTNATRLIPMTPSSLAAYSIIAQHHLGTAAAVGGGGVSGSNGSSNNSGNDSFHNNQHTEGGTAHRFSSPSPAPAAPNTQTSAASSNVHAENAPHMHSPSPAAPQQQHSGREQSSPQHAAVVAAHDADLRRHMAIASVSPPQPHNKASSSVAPYDHHHGAELEDRLPQHSTASSHASLNNTTVSVTRVVDGSSLPPSALVPTDEAAVSSPPQPHQQSLAAGMAAVAAAAAADVPTTTTIMSRTSTATTLSAANLLVAPAATAEPPTSYNAVEDELEPFVFDDVEEHGEEEEEKRRVRASAHFAGHAFERRNNPVAAHTFGDGRRGGTATHAGGSGNARTTTGFGGVATDSGANTTPRAHPSPAATYSANSATNPMLAAMRAAVRPIAQKTQQSNISSNQLSSSNNAQQNYQHTSSSSLLLNRSAGAGGTTTPYRRAGSASATAMVTTPRGGVAGGGGGGPAPSVIHSGEHNRIPISTLLHQSQQQQFVAGGGRGAVGSSSLYTANAYATINPTIGSSAVVGAGQYEATAPHYHHNGAAPITPTLVAGNTRSHILRQRHGAALRQEMEGNVPSYRSTSLEEAMALEAAAQHGRSYHQQQHHHSSAVANGNSIHQQQQQQHHASALSRHSLSMLSGVSSVTHDEQEEEGDVFNAADEREEPRRWNLQQQQQQQGIFGSSSKKKRQSADNNSSGMPPPVWYDSREGGEEGEATADTYPQLVSPPSPYRHEHARRQQQQQQHRAAAEAAAAYMFPSAPTSTAGGERRGRSLSARSASGSGGQAQSHHHAKGRRLGQWPLPHMDTEVTEAIGAYLRWEDPFTNRTSSSVGSKGSGAKGKGGSRRSSSNAAADMVGVGIGGRPLRTRPQGQHVSAEISADGELHFARLRHGTAIPAAQSPTSSDDEGEREVEEGEEGDFSPRRGSEEGDARKEKERGGGLVDDPNDYPIQQLQQRRIAALTAELERTKAAHIAEVAATAERLRQQFEAAEAARSSAAASAALAALQGADGGGETAGRRAIARAWAESLPFLRTHQECLHLFSLVERCGRATAFLLLSQRHADRAVGGTLYRRLFSEGIGVLEGLGDADTTNAAVVHVADGSEEGALVAVDSDRSSLLSREALVTRLKGLLGGNFRRRQKQQSRRQSAVREEAGRRGSKRGGGKDSDCAIDADGNDDDEEAFCVISAADPDSSPRLGNNGDAFPNGSEEAEEEESQPQPSPARRRFEAFRRSLSAAASPQRRTSNGDVISPPARLQPYSTAPAAAAAVGGGSEGDDADALLKRAAQRLFAASSSQHSNSNEYSSANDDDGNDNGGVCAKRENTAAEDVLFYAERDGSVVDRAEARAAEQSMIAHFTAPDRANSIVAAATGAPFTVAAAKASAPKLGEEEEATIPSSSHAHPSPLSFDGDAAMGFGVKLEETMRQLRQRFRQQQGNKNKKLRGKKKTQPSAGDAAAAGDITRGISSDETAFPSPSAASPSRDLALEFSATQKKLRDSSYATSASAEDDVASSPSNPTPTAAASAPTATASADHLAEYVGLLGSIVADVTAAMVDAAAQQWSQGDAREEAAAEREARCVQIASTAAASSSGENENDTNGVVNESKKRTRRDLSRFYNIDFWDREPPYAKALHAALNNPKPTSTASMDASVSGSQHALAIIDNDNAASEIAEGQRGFGTASPSRHQSYGLPFPAAETLDRLCLAYSHHADADVATLRTLLPMLSQCLQELLFVQMEALPALRDAIASHLGTVAAANRSATSEAARRGAADALAAAHAAFEPLLQSAVAEAAATAEASAAAAAEEKATAAAQQNAKAMMEVLNDLRTASDERDRAVAVANGLEALLEESEVQREAAAASAARKAARLAAEADEREAFEAKEAATLRAEADVEGEALRGLLAATVSAHDEALAEQQRTFEEEQLKQSQFYGLLFTVFEAEASGRQQIDSEASDALFAHRSDLGFITSAQLRSDDDRRRRQEAEKEASAKAKAKAEEEEEAAKEKAAAEEEMAASASLIREEKRKQKEAEEEARRSREEEEENERQQRFLQQMAFALDEANAAHEKALEAALRDAAAVASEQSQRREAELQEAFEATLKENVRALEEQLAELNSTLQRQQQRNQQNLLSAAAATAEVIAAETEAVARAEAAEAALAAFREEAAAEAEERRWRAAFVECEAAEVERRRSIEWAALGPHQQSEEEEEKEHSGKEEALCNSSDDSADEDETDDSGKLSTATTSEALLARRGGALGALRAAARSDAGRIRQSAADAQRAIEEEQQKLEQIEKARVQAEEEKEKERERGEEEDRIRLLSSAAAASSAALFEAMANNFADRLRDVETYETLLRSEITEAESSAAAALRAAATYCSMVAASAAATAAATSGETEALVAVFEEQQKEANRRAAAAEFEAEALRSAAAEAAAEASREIERVKAEAAVAAAEREDRLVSDMAAAEATRIEALQKEAEEAKAAAEKERIEGEEKLAANTETIADLVADRGALTLQLADAHRALGEMDEALLRSHIQECEAEEWSRLREEAMAMAAEAAEEKLSAERNNWSRQLSDVKEEARQQLQQAQAALCEEKAAEEATRRQAAERIEAEARERDEEKEKKVSALEAQLAPLEQESPNFSRRRPPKRSSSAKRLTPSGRSGWLRRRRTRPAKRRLRRRRRHSSPPPRLSAMKRCPPPTTMRDDNKTSSPRRRKRTRSASSTSTSSCCGKRRWRETLRLRRPAMRRKL